MYYCGEKISMKRIGIAVIRDYNGYLSAEGFVVMALRQVF
jgi:hypothetical protein